MFKTGSVTPHTSREKSAVVAVDEPVLVNVLVPVSEPVEEAVAEALVLAEDDTDVLIV